MQGSRPEDRGSKRRCSRCRKWKPRNSEHFKPSRCCREGLTGTCRECSAKYIRDWKSDNRERLSKKRRAQYQASEKVVEAQRARERWKKDPVRMRAQILRMGVVLRSKEKGLRLSKELRTTKYWADRLRNQLTCECCGRAFQLTPSKKVKSDASPSVDRVRLTQGYVVKNTALLCWRCNNLKRDASSRELFMIAKWMKSRGV
jgi:hypothetical protein